MTRPQKESDMKREHRITIRLTDTEFSIIENMAEQADMTISEYMRKQIMEGQVNTKFEIVADVKEIKKLIGELGKIGSNLNQIARHVNTGGGSGHDRVQVVAALMAIDAGLERLRQTVLEKEADYDR